MEKRDGGGTSRNHSKSNKKLSLPSSPSSSTKQQEATVISSQPWLPPWLQRFHYNVRLRHRHYYSRRRNNHSRPPHGWLVFVCTILALAYTRHWVWMVYNAPAPQSHPSFLETPYEYPAAQSIQQQQQRRISFFASSGGGGQGGVGVDDELEIEGPDGIPLTVRAKPHNNHNNPHLRLQLQQQQQHQHLHHNHHATIKNIPIIEQQEPNDDDDATADDAVKAEEEDEALMDEKHIGGTNHNPKDNQHQQPKQQQQPKRQQQQQQQQQLVDDNDKKADKQDESQASEEDLEDGTEHDEAMQPAEDSDENHDDHYPNEAKEVSDTTPKATALAPRQKGKRRDNNNKRRRHRKKAGPSYNRPTSIFFNMYMHPREVKRSFAIVHEQLRQVNESTHQRHQSTVHFNLMGGDIRPWAGEHGPEIVKTVCGDYDIKCNYLDYYPDGNENITLHQLWSHCREHPRHRVTYLHNKGSFRKDRGNTKIRRLATRSALAPSCLRMPLRPDYRCNQCSLKFHTLPYFHWTANIWTADCGYVQNLTDPLLYEQKRWDLYRDLWKEHQDVDCMPPFPSSDDLNAMKQYGLGRYSMERWLFSHPSMLPCDTTPLRLARFERGFEEWFVPKLREHAFVHVEPANETIGMYFLQREHAALYPGIPPSPTLLNYTQPLLPLQPCIHNDDKQDTK